MPVEHHRIDDVPTYRISYGIQSLDWFGLIHYSAFSAAKALDRNPGPGYDTLLLRLIQGDLLSACPIDSSTHYPAF